MWPITTDGDPIGAASSARLGPTTPVADLSQERIKSRPVLGGPYQRIRAGRIEAQVKAGGRVLEPHSYCALPCILRAAFWAAEPCALYAAFCVAVGRMVLPV